MTPHEPPENFSEELAELLRRTRPRVAQVCRNHYLTLEEAAQVSYECTLELARRWHALRVDREEYLLELVTQACHRRRGPATEEEES